jgi:hypothetical protein
LINIGEICWPVLGKVCRLDGSGVLYTVVGTGVGTTIVGAAVFTGLVGASVAGCVAGTDVLTCVAGTAVLACVAGTGVLAAIEPGAQPATILINMNKETALKSVFFIVFLVFKFN